MFFNQLGFPGVSTPLSPEGYEQIAVSTTAVSLTLPNSKVKVAICVVEDQDVRWRDDGVDPTESVGMLIKVNNCFAICASSLGRFRVIRSGPDATLNISYYS